MKDRRLPKLVLPLLFLGFAWWIFQDRETPPVPVKTHRTLSTFPVQQKVQTTQSASVSPDKVDTRELTVSGANPGLISAELIQDRRSQVKLSLASVYTAMASAHADYDRYTTSLTWAGYSISTPINFKTGFLTPFHPHVLEKKEKPEIMNTDAMALLEPEVESVQEIYSQNIRHVDMEDLHKYCQRGCTASETDFEIISVTNLDDDATLDVWLMDENKKLTHVVDDTKE